MTLTHYLMTVIYLLVAEINVMIFIYGNFIINDRITIILLINVYCLKK